MSPRPDPERQTNVNANRMAEAMTNLTNVVAQQAANATAQAAATAQRNVAEEEQWARQQQREEALAQARGLTDFRRHDPPRFSGETDPEKADLWVQEIEKIFEVLRTPEESKVGFATYLLLGEADYWWRGARMMMGANQVVVTWISFRTAFLEKYFPVSAREEKEAQFLKLYQGSMTVAEYAAKLESLAKHFRFFANHVDEAYLCTRFINGLRYEIEESVRPLGIRQFQPLVEKCREIEIMKNKRANRENTRGPMRSKFYNQREKGKSPQKVPYQRPTGGSFAPGQQKSVTAVLGEQVNRISNRDVACFKCGQTGHYVKECERLCYNCRKPGHMAKDCRAPRVEPAAYITRGTHPTVEERVHLMVGTEATDAEEET